MVCRQITNTNRTNLVQGNRNTQLNMSRFTHPIHARGLQSPIIAPPTRPLTNRAIDRYYLLGKYGSPPEPTKPVRKPKPPNLSPFSHLL